MWCVSPTGWGVMVEDRMFVRVVVLGGRRFPIAYRFLVGGLTLGEGEWGGGGEGEIYLVL